MAAIDATELQLDPPNFTIEEENNDLELWTFRLPVSLPVSALHDVTLSIDSNTTTTFKANGQEYRIQVGDIEEMESFRVLVPQDQEDKGDNSSSDSDDDDDDDDDKQEKEQSKKGTLRPCRLGFSKHFQVLANISTLTESQLAPRNGPPPEDKMRHAYAPIAQRTGLKRRWMPLGAQPSQDDIKQNNSLTPATIKNEKTNHVKRDNDSQPPRKRIKQNEGASDDSDSSSEDDKNLSKTERKAKRAEKKAAKKAKKEAKRAKKAAKKAKKEKP